MKKLKFFYRSRQRNTKYIDKYIVLGLIVLNLMPHITKEKLIEIIKGLLGIDADLNFLVNLDENELETLVAYIRDRIEQAGK